MTDFLMKIFVKDYENVNLKQVREQYGKVSGAIGIFCNILLCTAKILVGIFCNSISIIADGLNNLSDMGSSIITLIGFKLSSKPADRDHPFGHGRIEYMSAIAVSILILIVGIELFKNSVTALIDKTPSPEYSAAAIIILIFSVAGKLWMFLFNRKIGKKINSQVLLATAQDSMNDTITTSVILICILISSIVKLPFNLDAVMGCALGVFIFVSGVSSAKNTINDLLGKPPEKAIVKEITDVIMSNDIFLGIHDLIVHNYGPGRQFASVHVEVPQDIDIVDCHEIIDCCENAVFNQLGIELVIHMDPIDINNEMVNNAKTAMLEAIRTIDENLTIHDFRMTPDGRQNTNLIFDVVIPSSCVLSPAELKNRINILAHDMNQKYNCVITFDYTYTDE